ncbi:COMM domain-containing protein 2-like [Thomomys bottae]
MPGPAVLSSGAALQPCLLLRPSYSSCPVDVRPGLAWPAAPARLGDAGPPRRDALPTSTRAALPPSPPPHALAPPFPRPLPHAPASSGESSAGRNAERPLRPRHAGSRSRRDARRKCGAGPEPPEVRGGGGPEARSGAAGMLLDLSAEHREHLAFLPRVDRAVVAEFGRIAVEFLRRGSNPKIYDGAARKLNVSSDTIQHGVEGLTYLLTESSKLMISELDFQDSVFVLGFPEELNKLLLQLYLENRKEIRNILSELSPTLPSYHSLEWRLDVQLASRSLRQQIKPSVTLKLHLDQSGGHSTRVVQTDPATLLHLVQQLEQALAEMKNSHCRRVVRNIK